MKVASLVRVFGKKVLMSPLRHHLYAGGILGGIVFFILLVFQPFGTWEFSIANKWLFLFGYGLITALTYMGYYALGFALFTRWFTPDRWTLFREFLTLAGVLLVMNLLCLFYHHWFVGKEAVTFTGYISFLRYSLLMALLPGILFYYQKWIYLQLDKVARVQESKLEPEKLMVSFFSTNKNEEPILLPEEEIVWVKSEGNYVEVMQLKGELIRKHLIRNTLNGIGESAPASRFYRIHRSYLVNLHFAERVELEGSNYFLKLKGEQERLPVSRTAVKTLKQQIAGPSNA